MDTNSAFNNVSRGHLSMLQLQVEPDLVRWTAPLVINGQEGADHEVARASPRFAGLPHHLHNLPFGLFA